MSVGIYKKNQGYYTRVCSAIALTTLVFMGSIWIWDLLSGFRVGQLQPIYIQATGALLLIVVCGLIGYYLIGRKPNVVDFMIATEGEMKKVNWSTRREILGSTWIVIGLTVVIALLCFLFDRVFQILFQWIGVLQSAS